jgi:hypothetical protein
MSQMNRDASKGFVTSEAIGRAIRVKLESAGTVAIAGAGVEGIGTSYDAAASGGNITVELDHKSVEATASGAITIANPCYAAASGKVSATVSGRRIGIALASVTDGNKFEMMLAGAAS